LVACYVGDEGEDVRHRPVHVITAEILELPVRFNGADGGVMRVIRAVVLAPQTDWDSTTEEDREDAILGCVILIFVELLKHEEKLVKSQAMSGIMLDITDCEEDKSTVV
jgi:hypothetical protein